MQTDQNTSLCGTRLCTVLVVEDEPLLRLALADFLEDSGFHVLEACNAEEAIGLLKQPETIIDLVFSDVLMPGRMDGFGLAKWLRENRPQTAMFLASGYVGDANIGQAMSGVPFFPKPYSLDILAERIRSELASREIAAE